MLMLDKFHLKCGLNVTLEKNIPIGSGLGGGSSNAAVTLLAIKKLFELEISDCEILSLAEALGSDVPFFINGGAAKVAGRGEVIEPITPGKKYFILIFSNIEIETRGIYESLSENALCDELQDSALLDSQENSLESVVMKKYPELMQTKYWLSSFGKVRMSGTGSTLYIEFDSYESAHEVNMEIAQKYKSKIVSSLDSYEIFS